jgi:hypothetical protein
MSETTSVSVINGSTPLIKLETKEYPRYYRNLKADNQQTIFSSDTLPVDKLANYGYALVNPTAQPEGDSVTQGDPELREDGAWYQTWIVAESDPSIKFNDARARLLAEALSLVDTELAIGLPFEKEVDGKTITYHLQAGDSDRPNWLGVFQVAQLRKAAGQDDAVAIRTYENTFVSLKPDEIIANLLALFTGIDAAYKRYWEFKDAVNAMKAGDTLPALPDSFVE